MSNDNKPLQDFEGLGKILDHNYDNIRELDNPLPGWWLATFWITIVFAVGYYAYYEFMGGPSLDAELAESMKTIEMQVAAHQPSGGDSGDQNALAEELKALIASPEAMASGKNQYMAKCMACHGASGEGLIGPNLTDDFWIHGDGSAAEIYRVARVGVLDKGMPAWEQTMSPQDLKNVSAYIRTLHGTNPANGKPAQGAKVEYTE